MKSEKKAKPPSIELSSPFTEAILQNLLYQGSRNDCGPFTAATLIRTFTGKRVDPIELSLEMNKPVWRNGLLVIRRIPNWATFPWGIADILSQHGLPARWRIFLSVQELLHSLSTPLLYLPILLSWRPLWAHIMILVAYQPEHGFGFANTQSAQPTIDWLPEAHFLKLWKSACRCAVIVDPRGTELKTHA